MTEALYLKWRNQADLGVSESFLQMTRQSGSQPATVKLWPQGKPWMLLPVLLLGCWGSGLGGLGRSLAAEPERTLPLINNSLPSQPPLDVKAFQPGQTPPGVVTSNTISPTHLTIPSLWWVQEQVVANTEELNQQFGRELIMDWLAYPIQQGQAGRVDLMVDRQFWGVLDYLQRYEFVNRFSTIARGYGYNIRVFDSQATIVAAFTCDFSRLDLRLLQLSTELSGSALLQPDMINYSRSPIADQLSCTMAIETGTSSLLRRNFTPVK